MKKFSEIDHNIDEFKKTVEILPTGLASIDAYLTGGFLKKELVVLGAGTGRGKSLVAGQIFNNIATKGFKSAYFSLEISNEMLVSRLIGAKANMNPTKIMILALDEKEQAIKDNAKADLSVYEEFMDFEDSTYQYELLEKQILEGGYDFVVIDFIQNIVSAESDEYKRLSQVALKLQMLAKRANCCIMVLSQLSNAITKEKRTNIVEYKGSGSIGTVCDLGFFIEDAGMGIISIRLRKNRRGISGQDWQFAVQSPGGLLIAM